MKKITTYTVLAALAFIGTLNAQNTITLDIFIYNATSSNNSSIPYANRRNNNRIGAKHYVASNCANDCPSVGALYLKFITGC